VSRQIVYVGSDHAGFILKIQLLKKLGTEFTEVEFKDLGCDSESSVNYPDYAEKVARQVAAEKNGRGILICGSGLGMCIAANKIPGIRATSSWDVRSAHLSREHNDSNIICLGARLLTEEVALESVREWLKTPFAGGRHLQRVELIKKLEEKK
jgi:ribose 5-phosphate isomerase B